MEVLLPIRRGVNPVELGLVGGRMAAERIKVLQWGRVIDDAEIAALATGGGTTAYRVVFERW